MALEPALAAKFAEAVHADDMAGAFVYVHFEIDRCIKVAVARLAVCVGIRVLFLVSTEIGLVGEAEVAVKALVRRRKSRAEGGS